MDGFERRKEHSKEDIRKAAEELFTRFGADKVSVNDIARKAGVSQATIYNNFGSKEALVQDYHESIAALVRRRFRDILVLKKSYAEKLQGLFQSWIDVIDRYNIQTGGPRFSAAAESENKAGRISLDSEIENTLLEFIKEVGGKNRSSQDISEEAVMAYIRFFQEGISNHPEIQNQMRRFPRLSQDLLSLFTYGINGKDGATNRK